ncbi:hypothetical protein [Alteromonas lipotrueiana]|uniref:hypothetical protein n=1 Tax=Alteromonas lipotrueiana TaxID=2803815 RepID=UPI001C48C161|nr:hypothetical protein [Alteromonas lipotrueiana]
MVSLASKLTILGVLATSSFFAHSGGQVSDSMLKSAQPVVKSKLRINETADILDLSGKEYMRLMNSLVETPHAIAQGPGFKLSEHSAMIELRQLRESGLEISHALLEEVHSVMTEYKTGLAKYAGLTLE